MDCWVGPHGMYMGPPCHMPTCAVVRHSVRADVKGNYKLSEEFQRWPKDPTLTSEGIELAGEVAKQLVEVFPEADHGAPQVAMMPKQPGAAAVVVITSPYLRCVQTAVEIAKAFGPNCCIIFDHEVGEIYGPAVLGPMEPEERHRPLWMQREYVRENGVVCGGEPVGRRPNWPETVQAACRRFNRRFMGYLAWSTRSRQNFVIVTHADAVASTLKNLPMVRCPIGSISYCGFFVVSRQHQQLVTSGTVPQDEFRTGGHPRVCGACREETDDDSYADEEVLDEGGLAIDGKFRWGSPDHWLVRTSGVDLDTVTYPSVIEKVQAHVACLPFVSGLSQVMTALQENLGFMACQSVMHVRT